MLFHESVEDSIEGEGHWGQPHPTQFVLPVAHFLRCEPDVAALNVVQAGRNVLNLYLLGLMGADLDEIGFEGKLLGVGVDYSDDGFAAGWVLELDVDEGGYSEGGFDVVDDDGGLGMALEVEIIEDLPYFRVDEAETAPLLAHLQGQVLQLVVVGDVGFELQGGVTVESDPVDDDLVAVLC